jgi:flagellar hook-associated protein 3 FlgL
MIGRMATEQAVRNFLSDLQGNYRSLAESQRQVSTGKRILTPSDDPVGVSIGLGLRRDMSATDTWSRNIDDSMTWLDTTDSALGQALEIVQRGRELAVQGGNGTLSDASRQLIASEVAGLRGQFVEVGNSSLGGRFIFGGTATDAQPFDPAAAAAATPINTGLVNREVSPGAVLSVNITADRLQTPPAGAPDIFQTLQDLSDALQTNDTAGISTALDRLDVHQDNISALRGEGAAKINRLELTQSRFQAQSIAMGDQRSKIEDVDMAEAITNLTMRESVYKAALATGARVIQPTLVDFLR